ncbi:SRPBCC domain-containing protein [Fictibacillus aquaticus]|nr:SRPBCC domain-containing protein [Fictibacillus aquaticus]
MPVIHQKTYIKADKEFVYRTLTTAEGWNAWFTDDTSVELNGDGTGEIRLRWTNFGSEKKTIEDGGMILEAVPGKSFVFQWAPGESVTTISIQLESYKEGTRVMLTETGYSNSERDLAACIDCAAGWGEALTLLKIYLEHGIVYKDDLG